MLRMLDIQKIVRHSLGGAELPPALGFGYIELANRVGEWLCSMHGWRWLERPSGTAQINKNQCYVELPADFGELVHIPRYWGTNDRPAVQMTTMQTIVDARAYGYVVTPRSYAFLGAIVFEEPFTRPSGQSGASSGCPEQDTVPGEVRPRLELWPEPSVNQRLTISYRATWVKVGDDEDPFSLPIWLETLFIELCREFARGYVYEDIANLAQRLAPYTMTDSQGRFVHPLVKAAAGRDARVQVVKGPLEGGAVTRGAGMNVGWHAGVVSDPT